jgi:hypothetical protein
MKYASFSLSVYLLAASGLAASEPASAVPASSWTCRQAGLTRQVLVFYPEAPAQLPCEVIYAKPDENAIPRALWKAKNQPNYCEQKAIEFIEKLRSLGWHCVSDKKEN